MISHDSSKHHETSKFSLSIRNIERSKISSSNSRSDFRVRNRKLIFRNKDNKRKTMMGNNIKSKMQNKLYEIFEEEKGENMDNDLIRKPNISLKNIYKYISKRFLNKYLKHYTDTKNIIKDVGDEKPIIYDYYQINNLLENKKCKLKVLHNENNCYYNSKENLIDYIKINHSFNMLKFIITFLYKNNIYNVGFNLNEKNKYKISNFIEFIKTITDKLNIIHIYKKSNLFNIFEKIKTINNEANKNKTNLDTFTEIIYFIKNNNIFEFDNLEDLSKNLNEYTKYLPILINIPIIYYRSVFPNTFQFGYKINIYIRNYIIKRLNEIKINRIIKDKNQDKPELKERTKESITLIKDKINSYSRLFNDSILKAKGISFANKENLEEIMEDNKPIWSFFKNKDKKENRRPLYDHEIIDIQNFVDNIHFLKEKKKNNVVSFQDKKVINKKEEKEKDALVKKVNENIIKKKNIPSNINFSRNKNNRLKGILKQHQNKAQINTINNINFSNSNYKINSVEERTKMKNRISKVMLQRKLDNESLDKMNNIKIIKRYNSKKYGKNKNILQSLSDTKNSSNIYGINESTRYNKGKNIYELYKGDSFLHKSKSIYIIQRDKFDFKDTKKFFKQGLKEFKKLCLNGILLKSISTFNINRNMKHFFETTKHSFKYIPLKIQDIEENVWKNGIFKENYIKSNYDYYKLMKKVNNLGKRNNHQRLLDCKIDMASISKRSDIYS